MRTSLAILVLVIIGAIIYYLVAAPGATVTPGTGMTTGSSTASTTASTSPPLSGASALTLAGGNVSLSYPNTYGLAVSPNQVLAQSYIPPCNQGFDYCIYRTADTYKGTNFESAGISVTQRKDLATKTACLTTQPTGYTGLTPKTTTANTYSASLFSPLSNAAAGHYASGADYRLFANGACTEFETRIAGSQFANYPPGSIKQFTSADQAAVSNELQFILASVAVNGSPVEFPNSTTTRGE